MKRGRVSSGLYYPSKHSSWWRCTEGVLQCNNFLSSKTSSRHNCKTSCIHVLKTSWKHFEFVLRKRLQNLLRRRIARRKSVTLKTSSRRLGKQVMFLGMVRNSCHFICLRLLTTFLEFDPRLHCFYKLNLYWTYPDNWTLLYEALSMLATKKNACSRGKCTSLFKNPSHFIHFCKHKLCWIFNITQSSGLRWNFWSFLKLTSHLKNFLVIGVSNCCSASLSSVYLMV